MTLQSFDWQDAVDGLACGLADALDRLVGGNDIGAYMLLEHVGATALGVPRGALEVNAALKDRAAGLSVAAAAAHHAVGVGQQVVAARIIRAALGDHPRPDVAVANQMVVLHKQLRGMP